MIRVLVVDDEPQIAARAADQPARAQYEVVTAADGAAALR